MATGWPPVSSGAESVGRELLDFAAFCFSARGREGRLSGAGLLSPFFFALFLCDPVGASHAGSGT